MTRYRDRYEEIYRLLSRTELQAGSTGLEDLSLGPDLFGADTNRWLGFYTHDGLRIALEKYGFYRELERVGFRKIRLETRTDDPEEHLLRLWSMEPRVAEPLIELVVHRDTVLSMPVLNVEWLMLQNPIVKFSPRRPPLPGQRYPGLGVGNQVLELLRNVCHRLQLGGIVTVPSYFHNALFYSEEFVHVDAADQGAFLALCRDLIPQTGGSVTAVSWALQWEMVINRKSSGKTFCWFQKPMINPISVEMRQHFEHPDFQQAVQQSLTAHDFELFQGALKRALQSRGIAPVNEALIKEWINDV